MKARWYGIDTVDDIGIFLVGSVLFIIGLMLAFVLAVLLWITLSAVIERYAFYLRLKRACIGKELMCKKQHSLLRSFFGSYDGSDFIIYKNGEELMHLKLFPYFLRGRQCCLYKNGVLERRFSLVFWAKSNYWSLGLSDRELTSWHWYYWWINVFHSYRKTRLGFDKTEAKRVLLLPNENVLFKFHDGNALREVDNSVPFTDGSLFYGQKALLKKLYEERS